MFAVRLNRLIDIVRPPGRGPYRSAEIATGMSAMGLSMSAPYLSQLRSGRRDNPSTDTISTMAAFFGVEPGYFTGDSASYRRVEKDLAFLALRDQEDVRRAALDIAALPPHHRQTVFGLIRRLRGAPDISSMPTDCGLGTPHRP